MAAPITAQSANFEAITTPEIGPRDPMEPVALTEYPTSTTNPKRPRTVAAGYDKSSQTMTLMFRDGTMCNYFGISAIAWYDFKRVYSKGAWMNRNKAMLENRQIVSAAGSSMAQAVHTLGRQMQEDLEGTNAKEGAEVFGEKIEFTREQKAIRALMATGMSATQAYNIRRGTGR